MKLFPEFVERLSHVQDANCKLHNVRIAPWFLIALLLGRFVSLAAEPASNDPDNRATFWQETSLKRVFPTTAPGSPDLHLLAVRQTRTAFQAFLQNLRADPLFVTC
jgi:hypothetical protein